MRALLFTVVLFGCGDNVVPDPPPDPTPDGPVAPVLAPCLDRPTDLSTPPTGQLTCDLLPPGFVAR
jgi:hypothetical protein